MQFGEGARGWQRLTLHPAVWAGAATPPRSICANLSSVDASVDTIRGRAAAGWTCSSANAKSTTCAENVLERASATVRFGCPIDEVIASVDFASYGLPTGTCSSKDFARNPKCDSNETAAIVAQLCLGKAECKFTVSNAVLSPKGDPCLDTAKHFSGSVTCSPRPGPGPTHATLQFTYTVTVPAGSTASVVLSTFGAKASDATLTIQEGGVSVWADGKFVASPAIAGISGATAGSDLAGEHIAVEVGSGTYIFTVSAP